MAIETLNDKGAGIYRVTTKDNEYIVDLDGSRLMRFPTKQEDILAKNGYWFQVHSLSCRVGESMEIYATVADTLCEITFKRFSSPVIHITQEKEIPDGWEQ